MFDDYTKATWAVLALANLGAAANVLVAKFYYQLGNGNPFFMVLMGRIGGLLALPIHISMQYYLARKANGECEGKDFKRQDTTDTDSESSESDDCSQNEGVCEETQRQLDQFNHAKYRGSVTGAGEDMHKTFRWLRRMPWWLQPAVTGVLDVTKTSFAFIALLYLDGSVYEILSAGLSIVSVAFVSHFWRKRRLPRHRWYAVGVMFLALALIMMSTIFLSRGATQLAAGGSTVQTAIGFALLLADVSVQAASTILKEVILQETQLDSLVFVGFDQFYSLLIAIPLSFAVGPLMGLSYHVDAPSPSGSDPYAIWFGVARIFTSLLNQIFPALLVAMTSAISSKIGQSPRGLVLWIIALVVYYAGGDKHGLGEAWITPESYVNMFGYGVLILGILLYYRRVEC